MVETKHGAPIESTSIRSISDGGTFGTVTEALPAGEPITGIACRGARAMLGVSQIALCKTAKCGRNLLNDFENEMRSPRLGNVLRIRAALERHGAVFLRSRGVIAVAIDPGVKPGRTPRARSVGRDL